MDRAEWPKDEEGLRIPPKAPKSVGFWERVTVIAYVYPHIRNQESKRGNAGTYSRGFADGAFFYVTAIVQELGFPAAIRF